VTTSRLSSFHNATKNPHSTGGQGSRRGKAGRRVEKGRLGERMEKGWNAGWQGGVAAEWYQGRGKLDEGGGEGVEKAERKEGRERRQRERRQNKAGRGEGRANRMASWDHLTHHDRNEQ
jgi:hypothetical protein